MQLNVLSLKCTHTLEGVLCLTLHLLNKAALKIDVIFGIEYVNACSVHILLFWYGTGIFEMELLCCNWCGTGNYIR